MLITYFWEVIAFQGSEGSFTKHQLVIISQNLFIQLITASVMMVRDKFILKIVIESNSPPNQSLSMFLGRVTVSIMIPSWMEYHSIASLLLSISSHLSNNLLLSVYTPWWRETMWEGSVLPKNTTHQPGQVSNPHLSTQSTAF